MSTNPSLFNAVGYNRMIRRTVQLQGGEMRRTAYLATGNLYHQTGVYPRITGGGLPNKITTRAPTTPNSEADFSNRRVSRDDYHDATIVDRQDIDRMQADPRAAKNQILLDKFALLEDIVFQQAALGVAQGGDSGTTDELFDTGNIIDVTLGHAAGVTNAGWTYEKHKALIKQFGENLVNLKLSGRPTITIAWQQWDDMRSDDHYINSDYTGKRPVDDSAFYVPNYMGCDFIVYEQVPYMASASVFNIDSVLDLNSSGQWKDTDTTDIRACFATVKDAVLLEVKPDVITEYGKNPMLSYREQMYMEMGLGAVRMEEEKVIGIPCDQSPA